MMHAFFWVSYAVLWIVVVIQGLALLELIRNASIDDAEAVRPKGVMFVNDVFNSGDPLPPLYGISADDRKVANWESYLQSGANLIVLLTAHCVPCKHVASGVNPVYRTTVKDNSDAFERYAASNSIGGR